MKESASHSSVSNWEREHYLASIPPRRCSNKSYDVEPMKGLGFRVWDSGFRTCMVCKLQPALS